MPPHVRVVDAPPQRFAPGKNRRAAVSLRTTTRGLSSLSRWSKTRPARVECGTIRSRRASSSSRPPGWRRPGRRYAVPCLGPCRKAGSMLLTAAAPQSLVEVRPRGLPCRQQTGGDSRDQRQQRAYRDQRQLDAKRFRVDKNGCIQNRSSTPPPEKSGSARATPRPPETVRQRLPPGQAAWAPSIVGAPTRRGWSRAPGG